MLPLGPVDSCQPPRVSFSFYDVPKFDLSTDAKPIAPKVTLSQPFQVSQGYIPAC
jgi:hypothetical protein